MADSNMTVLTRPTVGDVIKLLSEYPPDKPLRIEDADTNWTIEIIHVQVGDDAVWLSGNYAEMTGNGSYNG